jgi:hypothetical protein
MIMKLFSAGKGYEFPYNIWVFVKYFWRDVKLAKDRVVKGYSNDMFWSFDLTQADLIEAATQYLQGSRFGTPQELCDEFGENAPEVWGDVLFIIEEGFSAYKDLSDIWDLWDTDPELREQEEKRLQKEWELGMYFYVRYFDNLWD